MEDKCSNCNGCNDMKSVYRLVPFENASEFCSAFMEKCQRTVGNWCTRVMPPVWLRLYSEDMDRSIVSLVTEVSDGSVRVGCDVMTFEELFNKGYRFDIDDSIVGKEEWERR